MHGRTAGEVQAAELVGPAVCVPSPIGDWVVDDGGPDEDEDECGEHATPVSCGTDGKGRAVG